jgi:uncharacterized RDD family membrane protein YckC
MNPATLPQSLRDVVRGAPLRRRAVQLTLAALCVMACLGFFGGSAAPPAHGGDAPDAALSPSSPSSPSSAPSLSVQPDANEQTDLDDQASADRADDSEAFVRLERRHFRGRDRNDRVNVGHDTDLAAGEHAHSVVSVFGSASSEGEATGDVVSILGNTRVTGTGSHDAVAVLGNTYVDTHIDGDVVAVLGSVELGPHADIGGDVTAVGGTVRRDPGAVVHGEVQEVGVAAPFTGIGGLHGLSAWVRHALLLMRPLGFGPGLGWAWVVALAFLALYVCLALVAPTGIDQCERTLRERPGGSVLTAVLTVLATPVAVLVLLISVVGIAAIPVLMLALLCAGLFGKAVVLTWLGRRCLGGRRGGAAGHPALAVLIGGAIVLALYLVPVLGFVLYKVLGLLGLGTVIYTLVLALQAHRSATRGPVPRSPPPGAAPPAGSSPDEPSSGTPPPVAAPAADTAFAGAATSGASSSASADVAGRPAHPGPASVAATLPRAGFWVRIAALLLDAILIGIVVHELPHSRNLELLALAIYGAVMWKLRGSTIGGIVFDLQVVRLDGLELDWATVIVRALGCFLSLVVVGLGFIWIAIDEGKQAWHDKFAGTVVVRLAHAPAPL